MVWLSLGDDLGILHLMRHDASAQEAIFASCVVDFERGKRALGCS
jgi:hypothetical protein